MPENLKILIVEDNRDDADLLRRELKKSGLDFTSEIVQKRTEFELALDNFNPDLILSDYSLPSFDAVSAFRIKQEKLPHIPFIIISGVIGEENAVALIKDGVTDFASKDKLFTLYSKINRALKDIEDLKEKQINAEKLKEQSEALLIANKELLHQNKEKEKRATELTLALNKLEKSEAEVRKLNEKLNNKFLKRVNQYAFLSELNKAIVHDKNEEILFMHMCRIAIQFDHFKMAWIGLVDSAKQKIHLINQSGIPLEDLPLFKKIQFEVESPQEYILKTGSSFLCNNIAGDPAFEKDKKFFTKLNISSCILLPIQKAGKLYGILNLYADQKDFFDTDDIALLEEAAKNISFSLDVFEKGKLHDKAEDLLKKSEEFNRGVLNSLSSHIAVVNSTGKIIAVNDAWRRFASDNGADKLHNVLTGANYFVECENALARGNEASGEALKGMKSVLEDKQKVFYLEYPCHSPSVMRWFGMRAIKFEGITPMLIVSHVDISERKFAEERLIKSEASLKEAQNIAHTGNWEIDLITNIVTWSDEIYNILGVEKTEKPSADLFLSFIHNEDRKSIRKNLKRSSATREISSTEFRFIGKNKTLRHGCIERKMVFDDNKNLIRMYGIMQDITERKAAGEVREKLTQDLIQRNRELEQFTFMLSHDLRAPTANIIGFAENLQNENLSPDDQKLCLTALSMSVERLDTIIKDINTILRLKGDIKEKKETIHFSKIVSDIVQGMENVIHENHIDILSDFSAIDEIHSIRIYFHSIFYNLISNSIKYRNTRVKSFIKMASKNENGVITLIFQDNGLGLDMKAKASIFGLYKRFHTHIEGRGMGLFMVKTQIESMGGTIKIESEINKGTKFTVVFPTQLIIKA